jgi:hypothetical protein
MTSSVSLSSSATASTYSTDKTKNPFETVHKDMSSLSKSLNSGDLDSAKTAYNKLQTDQATLEKNKPADAPAIKQTQDQTDMKNAMDKVGDALNSGDLEGAQSAFSTVQSNMKNHAAGGMPPEPPSDSSSSSSTEAYTSYGQGQYLNVTA